ncbi:sulfite exporter TauE/SafE family protein [Undibacterium fentianense]|uniref:Sulfite exporter TauE/SafE family protein n=1 Tax=Undibacterium fentianense TaxID=2828728 RepID=A0A941DWW1_9BURK|nr:sulfite exporter TauE/SafE family protein [Undibacterium fentianense]MBR7798849.1 sulfite exporter TauE/SafE family protein [Undibacterium fentianense]
MLTFPLILAALAAGGIGGFHCVGMCGGIASIFSHMSNGQKINPTSVIPIVPISLTEVASKSLSFSSGTASSYWFFQAKLHLGRLFTYGMVGAAFGGLGGASLSWKVDSTISSWFYYLGNFALILLGLRLAGIQFRHFLPEKFGQFIQYGYTKLIPLMQSGRRQPFLTGMAWGALPCGLSYAIAPFALLSGAMWSGALLMVLFGLAALPHLLVAQAISRKLKQSSRMQIVQMLFAFILITLGVVGMYFGNMDRMPDFLCVTPR